MQKAWLFCSPVQLLTCDLLSSSIVGMCSALLYNCWPVFFSPVQLLTCDLLSNTIVDMCSVAEAARMRPRQRAAGTGMLSSKFTQKVSLQTK